MLLGFALQIFFLEDKYLPNFHLLRSIMFLVFLTFNQTTIYFLVKNPDGIQFIKKILEHDK